MKRIAHEAGLKPRKYISISRINMKSSIPITTILFPSYRTMIEEIEDFNTYSAGEKISNFIYTSFDLFAEQESFVQKTYHSFIYCPGCKNTFKERYLQLVQGFFGTRRTNPRSQQTISEYCLFFGPDHQIPFCH